MKYLLKHKFTALIIVLFILGVIALFFLWDIFFSNNGNPVYGNRLDGIEKVEISKSKSKEITNKIKENDKVKQAKLNISGRTIELVITVNDDLSISDSKKIGASALKLLDEEQLKFYSVQIFVNKEDETKNNFPIIGYKQKEKEDLVWTKDREVTSTDEK